MFLFFFLLFNYTSSMKFSIISAVMLLAGSSLAAPTTTDIYLDPSSSSSSVMATTTTTSSATSTKTYIAQVSPVFPSNIPKPTGVVTTYNYGPYNTTSTLSREKLKGYPEPFKIPDIKHPEVQAAIKAIDWSKVPDAPVRKQNKNGDFKPDTDGDKDPYCWWSDTNCVKPKIDIPEDFHSCPRRGDWGLSYDDGPFNPYSGKDAATENPYAEPALYNFLAENGNQKATLFVSFFFISRWRIG